MSHAFLAPSSAGIWSQCAGSPILSTMVPPQIDTPDTLAGEASHWALEKMLVDKFEPELLIGTEAPNGVILDFEMVECAHIMVEDVRAVAMDELHVEKKLQIPSVHEKQFGTPDAWGYTIWKRELYLWDYKFGRRDVPADSWQNINYVAGILDKLHIDGIDDQIVEVIMTIVQPRSFSDEGPIKRWRGKASELRGHFNILMTQAAKAYQPDPGVNSGSHCRDCMARHICPGARHAASTAVDYVGSAMPDNMTPDALSFELGILDRGIKAIEYRRDAIRTQALALIQKGQTIPGYGQTEGVGHRKFKGSVDELIMVGEMLGVDMKAPSKLITPSEFDRRLVTLNKQRKENGIELVDKSVISAYIVQPSTGAKLVPNDETLAVKAFTPKGTI